MINKLPHHLTIEELAAQEQLPVDVIQAAYNFRNWVSGASAVRWFDGPKLLFVDSWRGFQYGEYCRTTIVNGHE